MDQKKLSTKEIKDRIASYDIKVTTQRIAIYEALQDLDCHPTAEQVYETIKEKYPTISLATVYKTLETFVQNNVIKKVHTESDVMRYDVIKTPHHHLYYSDTGEIQDYYDEELQELLEQYFERKGIPDFEIEEINLQISGKKTQKRQTE